MTKVKLQGGPAKKLTPQHWTRMRKIVEYWYPEAKDKKFSVHDLRKGFEVKLTAKHIQNGVRRDCVRCAVGLAVSDDVGAKPIIVARGRISYVIEEQKKLWKLFRVGVPLPTALVINRQDNGGDLEPGPVRFTALTPTQQIGARKSAEKPRGPHTNPTYRSGLRSWLGETA